MASHGRRLPRLSCRSWGGSVGSQGLLWQVFVLGPHQVAARLARGACRPAW